MSFAAGFAAGVAVAKKKFGGGGGDKPEHDWDYQKWLDLPEPNDNQAVFLIQAADGFLNCRFYIGYNDYDSSLTEDGFSINWGDGSDTEFDGIHIEGVKINGYMGLNSQLKNVTIQRCFIIENVEFNHNTENVTFRQCYMRSHILGQRYHANGLLISNCYVNLTINNFSVNSFVHIDHSYMGSMYSKSDREFAQFLWTNSIINSSSGNVPSGKAAIQKNCIFLANNYYEDNNVENCYLLSSVADIFADSENADYSPTRTFELKDPTTYVGTDGTPIGLSGGAGWNKVPSNPYVSKVNATLSGTQLNVTYEAGVNK